MTPPLGLSVIFGAATQMNIPHYFFSLLLSLTVLNESIAYNTNIYYLYCVIIMQLLVF